MPEISNLAPDAGAKGVGATPPTSRPNPFVARDAVPGPGAGGAPASCPNPFGPDGGGRGPDPGSTPAANPRPKGPPPVSGLFIVDEDDPSFSQRDSRYVSQAEYEADELVQTIRELVNNSRDDLWSGTASELLAAGQAKMRMPDATARTVGEQVKELEDYLQLYDNIYHYHYRSGEVMRHGFCAVRLDEDDDKVY